MEKVKLTLSFLLFTNLSLIICSQTCSRSTGEDLELIQDVKVQDVYQFRSIYLKSVTNCLRNCMMYVLCRSINYVSYTNVCNLNVISMEENNAAMEFSSGTAYMSRINIPEVLAGKCKEHSCNNDSVCMVDHTDKAHCIPMFEGKLCKDPTQIPDAFITGTSPFVIGKTLTYTCDSRYAPSGQAAITCMDTLEWTPNIFECQRVREVVKTLSVSNGGYYGNWGNAVMCPTGSYVTGYSMKISARSYILQDDTALNAIMLRCTASNGSYSDIVSDDGGDGSWLGWTICSTGHYIIGFTMQVHVKDNFEFDGTGANFLKFSCREDFKATSNIYTIATEPGSGEWGEWGTPSSRCDVGTGVCGMRTRVENFMFILDDTGLNDLELYCCS